MRIGIFHTTLPEPGRKPGGVEVYVERLARRLAGRGHAVKVFSFTPAPAGAPYEHVRLRPGLMARSKPARLVVAPLLLNGLETSDLDVLHLHGDDWFFLRRRLPTVRTFHGSALYESRTATSLKRRLSQALVYPLELLASRLATRSYAVAPGMPSLYRLHGMLHCGVEAPSNGSATRSETPSVLFVGTWDGRKRGRLLAQIFEREVRKRVPDAELWLVTDRGEPAAGVRVIQAPSDAELAELYERAWVFCLPSEYEGFGIPYIEAMSHGAAVVASANPGASYVLEERAGLAVGDAELGQAIVSVLTEEPLRRRLVEAGRRRACVFSWHASLDAHEAAYQEAVAAWSSGL